MKPPTPKGRDRVNIVVIVFFVLWIFTRNDTIGGLYVCVVLYRIAYGIDLWRRERATRT